MFEFDGNCVNDMNLVSAALVGWVTHWRKWQSLIKSKRHSGYEE